MHWRPRGGHEHEPRKIWSDYPVSVTLTTYLRIGATDSGSDYPRSWVDEVLGFSRTLTEVEIRHYALRRRPQSW